MGRGETDRGDYGKVMIVESGGNDNGSDDHDCGLDGDDGDRGDGKIYLWKMITPSLFCIPEN